MEDSDLEVSRVAEALRQAIWAKSSQRRVETALGQSKGYLSQLLNGNVDLKFKHLFRVLGLLGVEPADFFGGLYKHGDALEEVMDRVRLKEDLEKVKLRLAALEHKSARAQWGRKA